MAKPSPAAAMILRLHSDLLMRFQEDQHRRYGFMYRSDLARLDRYAGGYTGDGSLFGKDENAAILFRVKVRDW